MKPFGCETILDCFEYSVKRVPNRQFLGTRNLNKEGKPYEWKTFKEVSELKDNLARGIK